MFQASRNWSNIGSIVNVMIDHLARLPHSGRDLSRNGIKLVDEHGELIENYDIIFKELFCAAARALAEKTKSNLSQVGILWDEILPTGTGGDIRRPPQQQGRRSRPSSGSDETLAEKGEVQRRIHEFYRGSLMFLVRRVESSRETTDLEAAGYRFADVQQVSGIISSSMQIQTHNVEAKLASMARYAEEGNSRLGPGVHLGFFAVRARVGGQGFDVLVRTGTRHLLPSVQMPIERLEPWQLNMLRQFDGLTPTQVARMLESSKHLSSPDHQFASQFASSLAMLRNQIEDDIFDDATFTSRVVQVPCRPSSGSPSPTTCSLLTFKLVVPIHQHVKSPGMEFIPLSLFRVHQLVHRDSPHNLIFSRSVHREISPILNAIPVSNLLLSRSRSAGDIPPPPHHKTARDRLRRLHARLRKETPAAVDSDGNPIPVVFGHRGQTETASNHSSSTLKLWNPGSNGNSSGGGGGSSTAGDDPKPSSTFDLVERSYSSTDDGPGLPLAQTTSNTQHQGAFGGIMVSQEITVDVVQVRDGGGAEGLRRKSVSCVAAAPVIAAAGPGRGDGAIEMQPWGLGGSKAGVTVQAESLGSETSTFVDELFAICVEGR